MLSKWVFVILVLLLFNSCLTQEQRKQKAIEYGQKGLEAANNQQYNESLKYYNQGIDLDSTNPALFLAIGNVMYQIGDTTKALYNYKKVLSLNISDSTIYNNTLCNLGILYLEKKNSIVVFILLKNYYFLILIH